MAYAIDNTIVVRPPQQSLATFGTTTVRYYLVSEPVYADLDAGGPLDEAVVREGVVRAQKPQVVTPYYMLRHEGFGENARRFLELLMQRHGPHAPALLYSYKNESMETSIVSGDPQAVAARIASRLDDDRKPLEAVIRGVGEMWDVSLMKFIFDLTSSSIRDNVAEMHSRGMLEADGGVPRDVRVRVEHLLELARRGEAQPADVHKEMLRWGLFDEYQDRFLDLFRRR
ncbi:MAG: hypothetical protein FJ318_01020 [SAR202 cluster bacterium]|nr:hypothetical protein [SAR202 cluster bacterium]